MKRRLGIRLGIRLDIRGERLWGGVCCLGACDAHGVRVSSSCDERLCRARMKVSFEEPLNMDALGEALLEI